MWYRIIKQSQIGTQQPSLFFDPWAEGAEIKDENYDAKQLYHGTLNDFDEFDIKHGNPDNYLGKNVIYTTDSLSDVNNNYAAELGPDLEQKINFTSGRIVSRLEDDPEYAKQVGINPTDYPNSTALYKAVEPLVREQLGLKYPKVLPLYGKMKNPAILAPYQPTTYSIGEWDEDDNYTPGNADDIFQEITNLAYEFNLSDVDAERFASQIAENLNEDGFNAYDLNEAIRESYIYNNIEDEDGNLAGQEFIKQLFQRLGHDGVILDAYQTFKEMKGVDEGTKHYMFFEPSQLKSAIGNQGTYNPNSTVLTSETNGGWYKYSIDKKSFAPYQLAQSWVQKNNIKSYRQFTITPRPWYISSAPHITYKNSGWTNWQDFLGTENSWKGPSRKIEDQTYVSYEVAKQWAIQNRIHSRELWITTKRPKEIPTHPEEIYKNSGWTNWQDFLPPKYISYEEAKNYIKPFNLRSYKEWTAFAKSPNFPKFIPHNLSFYRQEFKGLPDFLGYIPITKDERSKNIKNKIHPIEYAKQWAKENKIKTEAEYRRAIKPDGIPKSPNLTYTDRGTWSGWDDFLGKHLYKDKPVVENPLMPTNANPSMAYISCGWYKFSQMTKELIIMRGVPGSGKSTKAQNLGQGGVVYGTDEFFTQPDGQYVFDVKKLGHNHEQNRLRTEQAMLKEISPIVVDNTNVTIKEVRPYYELAQKYGYSVRFEESDTPWRFDVDELTKRNTHGVPREKIQEMVEKYQPTEYIQVMLDGSASAA